MYFHKIHHPSNFSFTSSFSSKSRMLTIGKRKCRIQTTHLGEDVWKVVLQHKQWPIQYSQAVLTEDFVPTNQQTALTMDAKGHIIFGTDTGKTLLATDDKTGFGISGKAWLFKWHYDPDMQFYGMGEKTFGYELSGKRTNP